jgi:cation diffusion facilitator family transporter
VDHIKENSRIAINTVYWSIAGNTLLALIKGFAGIMGNSYALIADSIESTTDIFSSILVLFGLKYASRPPDENHPYGHGKAEPLITFAVVGFLIVSATVIATESIHNIQTPHAIPEWYTIVILAAIVVFKEINYRFVQRRGEETESSSLKADAWHHRSDAITSLTAMFGIGIALCMGPGYETADDWAALAASGFILYNAYLIFRPALGEIMDEHVHDELIAQIRQVAVNIDGVRGTEKCFVRKTGMHYFVDLHIMVDGELTVTEGHDIAHSLKDEIRLRLPQIVDILIHVEPV